MQSLPDSEPESDWSYRWQDKAGRRTIQDVPARDRTSSLEKLISLETRGPTDRVAILADPNHNPDHDLDFQSRAIYSHDQ